MWGAGGIQRVNWGISKWPGVLAEASTQIGADGFAMMKKLVSRASELLPSNESFMRFATEIS
jgi:hypothetical protein